MSNQKLKEFFKRLVELANNAKLAYQEMIEEYEKEECENILLSKMKSSHGNNSTDLKAINENLPNFSSNSMGAQMINNNYNYQMISHQMTLTHNPIIPSHMGHSRTPSNGSNISIEPYYQMNYHTHSRSASGNYNFAPSAGGGGHSRSASGGGGGTLNIDLTGAKHWTHSRTPSNCSNISFISRLSEPISEVGCVILNSEPIMPFYITTVNTGHSNVMQPAQMGSAYAAVQYYTEQVRQEMHGRESNENIQMNNQITNTDNKIEDNQIQTNVINNNQQTNVINSSATINGISSSLVNLHLGCIDEIDAGNEADTEDYEPNDAAKIRSKTITKNEEEENIQQN